MATVMMVGAAASARAGLEAGRGIEADRNTRFVLQAGMIAELDGFVQETTRAFYDATGREVDQADAERFDFSDFDAGSGDLVLGFTYEQAWKYITFQLRVLGMNPQADSVARRNYYIDVDEVYFNGVKYENMQIPEGTPFSAELLSAYVGMQLLYTPFHLHFTENTRLSPMVGIGATAFVGTYDIDAGPARGVIQYQNPPEDFVVGGSAKGTIAGGLPELVLGAEFVFGEPEGYMRAALHGQVGFFAYDGSSGYFTTSSRGYEKNADIDHLRVRVGATLDIPLESGSVVTLGLEYETINTEATLEQDASSTEEIIARRERFDKEVDFSMALVTGFIGLAF